MSQVPHAFNPTQQALQQSACAHPTGPIEMFMVACNMETDIKLDERLARADYKPKLSDAGKEIKQESACSFHSLCR
jgi:hypothetical protein